MFAILEILMKHPIKFWSSALISLPSIYLLPFLNKTPPLSQLNISDFAEVIDITDDTYNKCPSSQVRRTYYTKTSAKEIGYISYRLSVGQIGLFYIHNKRNSLCTLTEDYNGRGLGKQILSKAIVDIREYGTANTVWAVAYDDHPFWSNVWNKSFIPASPPHTSVTGSGYVMDI